MLPVLLWLLVFILFIYTVRAVSIHMTRSETLISSEPFPTEKEQTDK
ncbi:hypothetical protein [Domibacillus aminovorans]|nr:hypothetical protein [Domibacillus aminovorans]